MLIILHTDLCHSTFLLIYSFGFSFFLSVSFQNQAVVYYFLDKGLTNIWNKKIIWTKPQCFGRRVMSLCPVIRETFCLPHRVNLICLERDIDHGLQLSFLRWIIISVFRLVTLATCTVFTLSQLDTLDFTVFQNHWESCALGL